MSEPMKNEGKDYSQETNDLLSHMQEAVQDDVDKVKQGKQLYNDIQNAKKAQQAYEAAQSANAANAVGSVGASNTAIANGGAAIGGSTGAVSTGAGITAGGTGAAGGAAAGAAGTTSGVAAGGTSAIAGTSGAVGGTVVTGTTATGGILASIANLPVTVIVLIILVIALVFSLIADRAMTSRSVSNASLTTSAFETYETTDPETGETVTRIRLAQSATDKQNTLINTAVENVKNKLESSYDDVVKNAVSNDTIINALNQRMTGISDGNEFFYGGDASNVSKANTNDKDGNPRSFSCDFKASDVSYNASTQSGTVDSDYCHIEYSVGPTLDDNVQLMVAYAQAVNGMLEQYSSEVREKGAGAYSDESQSESTSSPDDEQAVLDYIKSKGTLDENSDIADLTQQYYAEKGDEYTSIGSDKFAKSLLNDIDADSPFFAPADPSKWTINAVAVQTKYAAKYTVSHLETTTTQETYVDTDPQSLTHGALRTRDVTTSKWVDDDTIQTGVWDSAEARDKALKNTSDTRYTINKKYEYLYETMEAGVPIYYDLSSYKNTEIENVRDYIAARYSNSDDDSMSDAVVRDNAASMTVQSMQLYWSTYVTTYIDFTGIQERMRPYFGDSITTDQLFSGADRASVQALSYGYSGIGSTAFSYESAAGSYGYSGSSITFSGGSGYLSASESTAMWNQIHAEMLAMGCHHHTDPSDHWCTTFVHWAILKAYGPSVHSMGNGKEVAAYMASQYSNIFNSQVSDTPAPGAIGSIPKTSSAEGSGYGHVFYVNAVDLEHDKMWISEETSAHVSQGIALNREESISKYKSMGTTYAVPLQ